MTTWILRREKILYHERYVKWKRDGNLEEAVRAVPVLVRKYELKMTKHPTLKAVTLTNVVEKYGATYFRDALARYITGLRFPNASAREVERRAGAVSMPFRSLPVFHTIKFTSTDFYALDGPSDSVVDSVHVKPRRVDGRVREIPSRFDTVLVNDGTGQEIGLKGAWQSSDLSILYLIQYSKLLTMVSSLH